MCYYIIKHITLIIIQLQICVISKLYQTIPEYCLITRNVALELHIIVTPHCIDHRPRDVNGHGRVDGRAGGPGADNRARNAQNGRGNNNNNGIITGNGEYFDLRAAQQTQRKKKQRVGLFLSRVRPDFRCRDVVSHVCQVTGLAVRCEPIPTRYDTYRSYCIRASSREIDRLMSVLKNTRYVIIAPING